MGNLVVCCDGTWQNAVMQAFSRQTNISRIRDGVDRNTVKGEPKYVKGVGTGGLKDRVLGGVIGKGLDTNLFEAYKYLVENYDVDPVTGEQDTIFIFGFSRGAYTARSLAGMISRVGLLKKDSLSRAEEALDIYRNFDVRKEDVDAIRPHCHRGVLVQFLGVFDTVGALGVPGLSDKKYLFHDVKLGPIVQYARQALAIDEPRMAFEPSLWEEGEDESECSSAHVTWSPGDVPRVKQVWFKGVHSDIGGGGDRKLSDITLAWMMREAEAAGGLLKFGTGVVPAIRLVDGPRKRVMRALYSIHNAIRRTRFTVLELLGKSVSHRFIGNGHRRLCLVKDLAVAVYEPLIDDAEYRPRGFARWLEIHREPYPAEKLA